VAAGAALLLLLNGSIASFEATEGIIRGAPNSVRTAMMFGEYFPNPGMAPQWMKISIPAAMFAEGLGTFLLVTMIFLLTEGCNVGRPSEGVSPVFIGGTVAAIIAVLAPLTQAGINPARDFGPRLVAFFAGWGAIAIPGPKGGFVLVYIAAPFLGGAIAAGFFKWVIEPLMRQKVEVAACACRPSGERSTEIAVAKD
jgi:glycerol uptake facilitator protein